MGLETTGVKVWKVTVYLDPAYLADKYDEWSNNFRNMSQEDFHALICSSLNSKEYDVHGAWIPHNQRLKGVRID